MIFRNSSLFVILFVRNLGRVCSQFWLSVRNAFWGPFHATSRGNPSLCWLGTNILWANWHFQNIRKEKRHITFFGWWPLWVSRSGVLGSKTYVLSPKPKEHKSFCPGTRPWRPVTGVTRQSFMCKSLMCLFCSLIENLDGGNSALEIGL